MGGLSAILTLFGAIGTVLVLFNYSIGSTTVSLATLGILGVSSITALLGFVGFILFMVAMHGFSRDYGERKIFSYLLYGFIITVVALIVIFAMWFTLVFANIFTSIRGLNTSGQATSTQILSFITPYLTPLILAASIASTIWILANYKAFKLLADKSEVQQFRTAAILFLLGGIVNIVLAATFSAMGYFSTIDFNAIRIFSVPSAAIQYLGWIFAAKSYYSIKAPPQKATITPVYTPVADSAMKYCPHCGTLNQADSVYCAHCGQKL